MVNETHLNQIFEHFGLCDYDVVQLISREVWKKKYDAVIKELPNRYALNPIVGSLGDENKFWKPEREVIRYGLGSIFIDESKEQKQMITRSQSRKYPTGHLYSIRSKEGNVWITADEVELYRKTKNAWAKDTWNPDSYIEVWNHRTARTFVNSYYLSHFAKLFRIPKYERGYGDPDGYGRFFVDNRPVWEEVWRFHRVEDVPKFLKI